jgi:hypothetical protein
MHIQACQQDVRRESDRMKARIAASIVIVFSLLLTSVGVAWPASPSNPKVSSPMYVLQATNGDLLGLYVVPYYSMYGFYGMYYSPFARLLWPVYGFLEGNEMVLWVDGAGTGSYPDSIVVAGKWDFQNNIFTGTWLTFKFPNTYADGPIQMWLYGIIPGEADKHEVSLEIASLYNFKDSRGFTWSLNFEYGFFYDGMVHQYQWWSAYGFKFGEEMFLWADAPENPSVHDFVYTAKYDTTQQKYYGAWLDLEGTWTGLVQWWSIP